MREEEKARIAREVHDELGSTLTALRMDLDWLGEQLPAELASLRQKRSAMVKLVEAAVAATRKIVTDLRPSILDDLGLAAALRWQASEHQKHTGVQVIVETPDPDIPIERDLFRIFQETLTNVARHAKATKVAVELEATDSAYVLQVRDNGVGMSPVDISKPESHGIRGIRERAQQLGGNLSVASQPDRGTTIVFSTHQMETAERLCKAIALINKGKLVLSGSLAKVKEGFGKNSVLIEYEGDGAFLGTLPGVARVDGYGSYSEIRLEASADPQAIFRAVAGRLQVKKFEIVAPTLHNIFIEKVGATDAPILERVGDA